MYASSSGGDSTEAQNYTKWALNPAAYQNLSNDQVDWAALAQQWIIMKEAGPPVPEAAIVQPPQLALNKAKKEMLSEGGEAPMDVENDPEDIQASWNDGGGSGDSYRWNQQQPPWNSWNNTWTPPPTVPPPSVPKPPLLPTPAYNQYPSNENVNENNGNFGYTSSTPDYQSGYWTSNSKVIKPHNKRYSKVNVPTPVVPAVKPVTLDAAKRKQLPAWIRDGLEKMERDKLKQVDRERERQEKEVFEARMKLREKDAMEILKSTVKEQQQKSKFESDEENDSEDDTDGKPLSPEPVVLTQEELMLKVRRTMTEILLKVTNREIYNICKEELQRHVKKSKASDHRAPAPSGANISARLGLGAYEGSDSETETSDDESNNDRHDSDAELKDLISKRKTEFYKTEREIEQKLAETEKNTVERSRTGTPVNSEDNDSQVDAKTLGNRGQSSNAEGTPPIKNNQSSRHKQNSSSSEYSSSDSDSVRGKNKSRYNKHSSSSESNYSNKNRRSRVSRSRSSDKKYYSKRSSRSRNNSVRKFSSYTRSRSRSASVKRRISRSPLLSKYDIRRGSTSSRSRHSKRSRSRSRTRSRSRSRRRTSYDRSRRSRSNSRHRRSRSRSTRRRKRSPSRSRRYRRSRSYSRGKRSQRH